MRANDSIAKRLDDVFQALGDPTRRALLESLCRGEQRVTELAASHPISLNAVSKHIKVLERAKLVSRRVVGREHFLQINPRQLRTAENWLVKQQAFWSKAIDSINEQLEREDTDGGQKS